MVYGDDVLSLALCNKETGGVNVWLHALTCTLDGQLGAPAALGYSHTASVFGRYFTLIYVADSGRTNKRVSVSGDGLSGAVLHRRARTCFAD